MVFEISKFVCVCLWVLSELALYRFVDIVFFSCLFIFNMKYLKANMKINQTKFLFLHLGHHNSSDQLH